MVDITVIIPTKNEERNLAFCLEPLKGWARKIVVVDSNSTDHTHSIAGRYNADVILFDYQGGWPKKRQFVLDTYAFETGWILLLDADEILTAESKAEIAAAIQKSDCDGYYLWFGLEFLGRVLKRSDPGLRKLCLFRTGKGNFEKRYGNQDNSMGDMEVHGLGSNHVLRFVDFAIHEIKINTLVKHIIKPGSSL